MLPVTLYPVAIAVLVSLGVGAVSWLAGDRRWTQIVVATGLVQAVGYVLVSRAMFWTSQLLPQQLFFASLAIAITTKIVVFSPGVLARVADPVYQPSFSRQALVVGLSGAWLIQASLALLFLFPTGLLGEVIVWVLPFSPVSAFVPLFILGTVVAQVTIAGSIYGDPETVLEGVQDDTDADVDEDVSDQSPTGGEPADPVAAADGGLGDD